MTEDAIPASDVIRRALARVAAANPATYRSPDSVDSDVQVSAGVTLPTAAARRFIDYAVLSTPEALAAEFPNLKDPLRDVTDWTRPKFTKATKAVIRALGPVFTGSNQYGSTYPQAVEMLGYLSIIAPMLEPDRLARIAAAAATTNSAFEPVLFPIGPLGQLRLLLNRFSEQRREELLLSLWNAAHDGRWWYHADGTPPQHRNRRIPPEAVTAARQQLEEATADGSLTLPVITRAMRFRALGYSDELRAHVRHLPEPTALERHDFVLALNEIDDEDYRILAANIPFLTPAERPASPIPTMLAILVTALGGPSNEPQWEFVEDPAEWDDLYPAASRQAFPYPPLFRQLRGQTMPGLACEIQIMRNPDELKRNGDFMGNCTFSYVQRCIDGSNAIGRTEYGGVEYNFALVVRDGRWTPGEINSRFNRGNVPDVIRDSVRRLAEGINAALAGAPRQPAARA